MNIVFLACMDILVIIALCITINMAKRHIFDKKVNIGYRVACVTTIILLILEITTILMEFLNNKKLVMPNRLFNIIGFSLSPIVPFSIVIWNYKDENKTLYKRLFAAPILINALVCTVSYKTGWVFYVNYENQYTRGSLFLLPTIISLFYYILIIKGIIANNDKYEKEDKRIIAIIASVPIIAILLQIVFRDLIIIWNSAAITLLLYYTFLRELHFTYDIQTGVKNRVAFAREMEKCSEEHKDAEIFMFDLNNLKETNDLYGHKAGDEMIFDTAKTIEKCFNGIGKTYRIGGDEFCVICEELQHQLVGPTLDSLKNLLNQVNRNRQSRIALACGHAFYDHKGSESIYSVLSQADGAMYINKAKLKGLYGRRSTDIMETNISTVNL